MEISVHSTKNHQSNLMPTSTHTQKISASVQSTHVHQMFIDNVIELTLCTCACLCRFVELTKTMRNFQIRGMLLRICPTIIVQNTWTSRLRWLLVKSMFRYFVKWRKIVYPKKWAFQTFALISVCSFFHAWKKTNCFIYAYFDELCKWFFLCGFFLLLSSGWKMPPKNVLPTVKSGFVCK